MKDRAMRIGEVARMAGVSPDTLRHYERCGLLRPAGRTEGGYRMYSTDVLDRVRVIRSALAVGFTIAELSRVFRIRQSGGTPCAQVRSLAEEKLIDLERRIEEMQEVRKELRSVIRQWDRILRAAGPGEQARLLDVLASKSKNGEAL